MPRDYLWTKGPALRLGILHIYSVSFSLSFAIWATHRTRRGWQGREELGCVKLWDDASVGFGGSWLA